MQDKNLALLKRRHPHLFQLIQALEPGKELRSWTAPTGKPNLAVKSDGEEIALHDPHDPEAEVPGFLQMIGEGSNGVVVLFGMGLGYTPLAILKERPNVRHLFIIEAKPQVFREALRLMDLEPLLSSKKVTIFFPQTWNSDEFLQKAGNLLRLEDIHFLYHLPSFSLDGDTYREIYDQIYSIANSLNIEGATFVGHGDLIVANRFEHLKLAPFQHSFDHLASAYRDVPAVLVAAGPSLDKNVHLLREAKGRAVIFAVDSALPALLRHDVVPDFVTSIDYHPVTYEKIAGEIGAMAAGTPPSLICTMWDTPPMFKRPPWRAVFRVPAHHPIDMWAAQLLGWQLISPGAQTVAHLNLHAALVAGCRPIIFVGLDLAYGGSRPHAQGTVLQGVCSLEKADKEALLAVKGNVEETVYTDRSFFSMKQGFEAVIASNPGLYINATEGGAYIEGTEVLPLQKALEAYCRKTRAATLPLPATKTPVADFMKAVDRIIASSSSMSRKLKKSNHLTRTSLSRLRSIKHRPRGFDQLPPKLKSQLTKLERINKEVDKRDLLWQFVEIMTINVFARAERLRYEVEELESEQDKYLEYLKKSLERLLLVNEARLEAADWLKDRFSSVKKFIEGYKELSTLPLDRRVQFLLKEDMVAEARDLLQGLDLETAEPGLVFCLGKAAALQCDHETAHRCFERLLSGDTDGTWKNRIEEFLSSVAATYLDHARYFADKNRTTSLAMILRGLKLAPRNEELRTALAELLRSRMEELQSLEERGEEKKAAATAASWLELLIQSETPLEPPVPEDMAELALKALPKFMEDKAWPMAERAIELVKEVSPEKAADAWAFQFLMRMDQGRFQEALEALREAVARNSRFAVYWEQIGELLFSQGLFAEAAEAFEQCFLHLPENVVMLKRMGDCYLHMGMDEAATAAYDLFKEKALEASEAGNGEG